MKARKILSAIMAIAMIAAFAVSASAAEEQAESAVFVAKIGEVEYESLQAAISKAIDGDTIYLIGTINEESVKLPAVIKNLTIDGQDTAIVKDTIINAADGNSVNYQGLTIKNTTFDNSRFVLGGVRNGDVIYKDIVFDNNRFINIVNTASMAAIHMNLASDDNEYIENFTFTNNVIDGVTGSNNSGVLLKSITGDVVFEGNEISNVAWNAVQVATAKADAKLVVKNNSFTSSGSSVLNIAAAPSATLENNIVVNDSNGVGIWYPAEARIGNTEYTDLQTAINDAANGAEIDIITNIELTAQNANSALKPVYNRESYAGLIIPDDKAITIDLNGNTISYVDEYADCDNLMVINLGNLTINDSVGGGKITYKPVAGTTQYSYFYSTIFNCGTLTVNGGTIENTAEAETDAFDNHSRLSHEYGNDCILTVNGGHLTGAYYYAIRQYTHYFEGVQNRVTINDGTIEGGIYMQHGDSWYYADASANRLNVDAYLTINGGNFIATSTDNFNTIKSRLANPDNNSWGLEINGGTFNDAVVQLLVQRGYHYGDDGKLVSGEAAGTRTSEWLEENGGFISGGTFKNIGSADNVTTNLTSFLAEGYELVANENGVHSVIEKKEAVIDPAFGTNNGVIKLDATETDHEVVVLATIDSLNYQNVGLEVTFGTQTITEVLDTVYEAVKAKREENGEADDISPSDFGGNGKFIFLSKVTFGITHDAAEEFSFRPFATKLDGTVIYGKTTTDTIGK